jgi:hypothetical protein
MRKPFAGRPPRRDQRSRDSPRLLGKRHHCRLLPGGAADTPRSAVKLADVECGQFCTIPADGWRQ